MDQRKNTYYKHTRTRYHNLLKFIYEIIILNYIIIITSDGISLIGRILIL